MVYVGVIVIVVCVCMCYCCVCLCVRVCYCCVYLCVSALHAAPLVTTLCLSEKAFFFFSTSAVPAVVSLALPSNGRL